MSAIGSAPQALGASALQAQLASEAARGFGAASPALVQAMQASAAAMFATLASAAAQGTGRSTQAQDGAPRLRQPDLARLQAAGTVEDPNMTAEARLALLLAQMEELLGKASVDSIKAKLKAFMEAAAARKANGERVSAELLAAQALANEALAVAEGAGSEAEAAVAAAEAARAEVERLAAELEASTPGTPEHEALLARHVAAKTTAALLQGKSEQAVQRLNEATLALDEAMGDVEKLNAEAGKLANPGMPAVSGLGEQAHRTYSARLNELKALLAEINAKLGPQKMEADLAFATKLMEARAKENMRLSEEYQEQVRKAAEAEKKMGCIGKIVGWVVTVVSVVAAPFTGGASMALAAVGLALALAEEITGKSLLGKVFEPLMTYVLQPLIKLISQIATDVLLGLGMDAKEARKFGTIIGAVLGAVLLVAVVVAAVVLGKGAGARLAANLGKVISNNVTKLAPEMLKSAARSVGSASSRAMTAVAKAAGSSADDMAVRAGQVMTAGQALQFANQAGQGVGQVMVADMRVTAAELIADLDMGLMHSQQLRELLNKSMDSFVRSNDIAESLFKQISDSVASESQAARFVVSKMRA